MLPLHRLVSLQQCSRTVRVTRQAAIFARARQCSKFNGTSFNGHFFDWVPYLRGTILRIVFGYCDVVLRCVNLCQSCAVVLLL